MEKSSQEHQEKNLKKTNEPDFHKSIPHIAGRRVIWDCESSLYDSFELKSFKKQLDSAIISSSRTLSMSHIPDRRVLPHPPPPPPVSKKTSKISKAFRKLIKSMFGTSKKLAKMNSSCVYDVEQEIKSRDHLYVHGRQSRALSSIPEDSEKGYAGLSPELNSCVRKTASERFTASSIGIVSRVN